MCQTIFFADDFFLIFEKFEFQLALSKESTLGLIALWIFLIGRVFPAATGFVCLYNYSGKLSFVVVVLREQPFFPVYFSSYSLDLCFWR